MLNTICRRWHGSALRSESVLGELLRIRQQCQRPHRSSGRRDLLVQFSSSSRDQTASMAQERQKFTSEAMKLLSKKVRGNEALSDVDASSVTFCVEVGKLLSVGAVFGASTTTPRIAEALEWVRVNKKHLILTRQVMSICMPLLNLKDGRTIGRRFVMQELIDILLSTLEPPLYAVTASESEVKQQQSAVISVLILVARMLEIGGGDDLNNDQDICLKTLSQEDVDIRRRMLLLFSKAIDVLLAFLARPLASLEVQECVHILQACQRLEVVCDGVDLEKVQTELLRVCSVIVPILCSSTTWTTKRPAEICSLLSVLSKLQQRPQTVELCSHILTLLPPSLASATVKEICTMFQILVRLRSNMPQVVETSLLRRVIGAARPKIFLIVETQSSALRHVECSMLMLNLSRLDVHIEEDLLNLFCTCFLKCIEHVQPAQLIPFLQGLSKCSDVVSPHAKGVTQTVSVWENARLPSLLPCLEQVSDLVVTWGAAGSLTSLEAAQLLLSLSQLHCPKLNSVFAALEKPFVEAVERLSTGVCEVEFNEEQKHRGEEMCPNPGLISILMNALVAFRKESLTLSQEEELLLKRANELLDALRQGAIRSIKLVKQPKELVMLLHLFIAEEEGKKNVENARLDDETFNAEFIIKDEATPPMTPSMSRLLDIAAQQVSLLASDANAYEVGALAKAVGDLLSRKLIGKTVAQGSVKALLQRSEHMELTLHDTRSLIDGMLRVGVFSIPPSFLHRTTVLLQALPKCTIGLLRRLLPLLRMATLRSDTTEVLVKLTDVAMVNTCTLIASKASSPLPLRDIVLFAFALAQLHNLCTKNQVENSDGAEEITEEDEDGDVEEVVEEEISGEESLQEITCKTFMLLGDTACLLLQRQGDTAGIGVIAHQISPQELVMLVQSFEKVGVRHHTLLYELLPLVRDMSGAMGALELSLLLNAFARLGVWNGRILNTLSSSVESQIHVCSLRQCQTILQALQSSHFLRPNAFLLTSEYRESIAQDWSHAHPSDPHATEDAILTLATSVVERMSVLVSTKESVDAILESHGLEDITAVVRVLGFFEHPPQPCFDKYYGVAIKRLISFKRSLESSSASSHELRCLLLGTVLLSSRVGKMRRYDHQCVAARAFVNVLTPHTLSVSFLQVGLRLIPEEKIAELYYARCVLAMLYNVSFAVDEAVPMLSVLSEKLEMEDVARNSKRISTVLSLLTRIKCKHIGDIKSVYIMTLLSMERLFQRLSNGMLTGDRKGDFTSVPCSSAAAAALVEALCGCHFVLYNGTSQQKKKVVELLSYFMNRLMIGKKSSLSLSECCVALMGTAVMAVAGDATAKIIWLTDLQHHILMKEKQITVRDAVYILLAGALTHKTNVVDEETICCAARVLVSQLGKTDRTGLWLLPELYHLITAVDACVLARYAQLPACDARRVLERVLPALLRSRRSATRNTAPTLSKHCFMDVVECYQKCAATWEEDDDDGNIFKILDELVQANNNNNNMVHL